MCVCVSVRACVCVLYLVYTIKLANGIYGGGPTGHWPLATSHWPLLYL